MDLAAGSRHLLVADSSHLEVLAGSTGRPGHMEAAVLGSNPDVTEEDMMVAAHPRAKWS